MDAERPEGPPWRLYGALAWALLLVLATPVALVLIVFFAPLWLALLFALYCFAVIGWMAPGGRRVRTLAVAIALSVASSITATEIWAAFGLTAWYWTFLWMAIGVLGSAMFIAGYDIDKGRFKRRRRCGGGQHRKRRASDGR
jgi:hypothetical protein